MADFYALPLVKVLEHYSTSEKGLTDAEARAKLQEFGPNVIREGKKESPLKIFLRQFNNFLIWILFFAVAISVFVGDVVESIVILIIIIMNAVIGFVQEYRAEKAVAALKKLAGSKADVLRNGERQEIDASLLVPGDIIFLATGDKISADCRLIELSNLEIQESSLTGESTPVRKIISLPSFYLTSRSLFCR